MALPPRTGARYVILGNPDEVTTPYRPPGATELPSPGNPTQNCIDVTDAYLPDLAWIPRQQDFCAWQDWWPEYPAECVVKVSQAMVRCDNFIRLESTGSGAVESTYPDNIVTTYNPGPPLFPGGPSYQPTPNPNGDTGNFTGTAGTGAGFTTFIVKPRWEYATPYNMAASASYDFWRTAGYFPRKNYDYIVSPYSDTVGICCSIQLTVENWESKVYNEQSTSYEYFPFTQDTFEYKKTAKVRIPIDWEVCCWNDGAVITGGVTFSSIDVSTVPLGNPFTPGYGFSGMTATTGETVTEDSSTSWSVTISSSYTAVEIEIPAVADKMSFITDFWIESVTPPT